jgi:hypothetical protein
MTAVQPSNFAPLVFLAVIGLLYARRIRRHFGRQRYQPRRALARIVLLAVVLCALLVMAFVLPQVAIGVAIGLVAGGVLGAIGLRHTRFEYSAGQGWYTPNPWIGGALSLVLLGRLAWRWQGGAFAAVGGGAHATQDPSALTLGIVAALLAFYLVNGTGLAWRMRDLARDADLPAQRA